MSFINYMAREINCKVVYYGPGLCGKTTNLQYIFERSSPESKGKMISLATETERTLFFDFLPLSIGEIGGFKTRFHLYTVPGQVFYDASRKLILKGADAVVFVADSQVGRYDANIESVENLRDNMREQGLELDETPFVMQYNKRDLPEVSSIEELEEALNPRKVPYHEAVARTGVGVFDTLKTVAKLVVADLKKKSVGNRPAGLAARRETGVLTDDVRFEGWDVRDWQRLLSLFRRPGPRRGEATGPSGGVIAVHDGGRLYKLLHTRVGRLELVGQPWPVSPEQLAATHDAAWAVSLHTGALDEVMERFGARATRGEDIVTQALSIAAIVREMAIEGAIDAWPARLASLRLPSASVIASTLSSLCPEGRVLAVGLFEDGDLYTAIAIRRRASGFDLVLGPDDLRGPMGLLSGDWRRDYRHLARAVEERAGPLAAGLFTETSTLSSLASGGSPGAWARAVAVRDVIVSPMSGPALLPLVVDAVHGTLHTARTLGERYDPTGRVAPALRALWGEPTDGESPRSGTLATAVRAFFDR